MTPYSNLKAILQDGSSLQYYWQGYGMQTVSISTYKIEDLTITSGKLIACDSLILPNLRDCFTQTVKPGRYPIIMSIADIKPVGDTRFACANLKISNEPTVRWEIATINNHTEYSYGVDSGTGSFMDIEAAEAIVDLFSLKFNEDRFEQDYCEKVLAKMKDYCFGKFGTAAWANIRPSKKSKANAVVFSSGWGDGSYSSFWGYDASGNITSLVTDFELVKADEV